VASSEQFKKMANALTKAMQTPMGQVGLRLLSDAVGEHLKLVIRDRHALYRAERDGHNHLTNALASSTQQDWETHLSSAMRGYMQHANGSSISYENFYANFWTAVACVKYNDIATARTYLNRTYQIGASMLDDPSTQPRYQDDPEWDRRRAVAYILDEIAPILTR
jgi:hypothetical protein